MVSLVSEEAAVAVAEDAFVVLEVQLSIVAEEALPFVSLLASGSVGSVVEVLLVGPSVLAVLSADTVGAFDFSTFSVRAFLQAGAVKILSTSCNEQS